MSEPAANSGSGEADTIILVPGLDGTALLFYRQIPLLANRFNVIAFPLPDDPNLDMSGLVEDLRALIDQLAAKNVILCGESFGGALSMSFALEHPELVHGLVIVNSFPVIRTRIRLRLAPLALRVVPWGAMSLVRRFTESKLHSPHALPEDLAAFHERSKQIGRRGYVRRLEILRHYDIRERLPEIRVPALYLAGDRDQLLPSVSEARLMSKRVQNGSLVILEGYGHICLINHDLNLLDHIEPWYDTAFAHPPQPPNLTA